MNLKLKPAIFVEQDVVRGIESAFKKARFKSPAAGMCSLRMQKVNLFKMQQKGKIPRASAIRLSRALNDAMMSLKAFRR